jgi:uncharacterized protein YukE
MLDSCSRSWIGEEKESYESLMRILRKKARELFSFRD